jgi:hypothetical protein
MTSSPATVVTDLPCFVCRYNLRTLAVDGRCPECGYEVFLTLHGGLPVVDTRGRRLRLAAACATLAATIGALAFLVTRGVGYNAGHHVWTTDPAWLFLPVAALGAVAMVLFALPQTHLVDGRPLFRRSRWVMLATAPAGLVAVSVWEWAWAWAPAYDFATNRRLVYVPLLAAPVGVLCAFRLLTRLARPLGLKGFYRPLRLMTACWWLILPLVLLTLSTMIPVLGPLWQHRSPFPLRLPHAVHEALERVIAFLGLALYCAYFLSSPLLALLAVALATRRSPDGPLRRHAR